MCLYIYGTSLHCTPTHHTQNIAKDLKQMKNETCENSITRKRELSSAQQAVLPELA